MSTTAALHQELEKYYRACEKSVAEDSHVAATRDRIWARMDEYCAANPQTDANLLKAKLHETIADEFDPVIFPHSPFFYEMGVRPAQTWGTPNGCSASNWMFTRRVERHYERDSYKTLQDIQKNVPMLLSIYGPSVDLDHYSLGYTKLLSLGINGIISQIEERLASANAQAEKDCLSAMASSCRTVIRIAQKFSDKANEMLKDETDPQTKEFLSMIATSARRIPANPPSSFYEGLATLWFLRETAASLENIGISVVGHVDRLLIDLYRNDIAQGVITEDEARDLLTRWMMPTDIKFFIEESSWPETSTCMELGGCDENGEEVFNELTRLILEIHESHNFANPKPNCRISADSSEEYLRLLSRSILKGHNVYALLNDDVLIPACVNAGKDIEEARLYVNGGCQETIVEGVEHSAGAYYYFNMAKTFDLCMQEVKTECDAPLPPELQSLIPKRIEAADSFEDFYSAFKNELFGMISRGAALLLESGLGFDKTQPCPFFSATLKGCIENAADYTTGSAKYNPSTIALVGLGTVVDSLIAIKHAVYEKGWLSLEEFRKALSENWDGHEELRARIIALPKFGFGEKEVDALARRFTDELTAHISTLKNERGGNLQMSYFVYYQFRWMGANTRATPDGRKSGDDLSQGCAPGRLRAPESLTDVMASLSALDFTKIPANAVLDVQLPAGNALTEDKLAATIRTFCRMGGPTLQPNTVSLDVLKDAQANPDKHRDLMVRISGLSAKFVALNSDVQNEIIDRTIMHASA